MDPRMLRYYNEELAYMRELGAEFAGQFPKIGPALRGGRASMLRFRPTPGSVQQ